MAKVVTTTPEEQRTIPEVIDEKGMDWVVAAMFDGSIGYHTPESARRLIQNYLRGDRTDWCERCMACFSCNLEKMIRHDISMFEYREQHRPGSAQRIIAFCKKVEELEAINQTTIGLMYPTMAF